MGRLRHQRRSLGGRLRKVSSRHWTTTGTPAGSRILAPSARGVDPVNRISCRLLKAVDPISYVALIWLTWRFLDGELHWRIAIGAVVLSGGWLVTTLVRMNHLFKTYFDVLSRLEFSVPWCLGVGLAGFAVSHTHLASTRVVAAVELLAWALLLVLYRRNRRRYVRQGHGPLPAGCWVSPPAEVLRPGDLILTSGLVAAGLREAVGHGETVIRTRAGGMESLSSYMDRGAVLHPVAEFTSAVRRHGHYVVLRLRDAPGEEQVERAEQIAREMLAENAQWRTRVNERRRTIIGRLPLPAGWKAALARRVDSSGYDWMGLFMGRLAPHRWTCIGACLELYRRLGVQTDAYGTGLLGFGTTLLDPIMPVRFLSDSAFRLVRLDDREGSGAPPPS